MNYKKISHKTNSQNWTRKPRVCLFFWTEGVSDSTRQQPQQDKTLSRRGASSYGGMDLLQPCLGGTKTFKPYHIRCLDINYKY